MSNLNTTAPAAAVRKYDKNKAHEACVILDTLYGLLTAYNVDAACMTNDEISGLGVLMKWIHEAVYQDGLVC